MLSSFSRGPWVFTLLLGAASSACAGLTPAKGVIQAPSAAPRQKAQAPATRGTVEAFLQPGSATEVESVLADSELAEQRGERSRVGAD